MDYAKISFFIFLIMYLRIHIFLFFFSRFITINDIRKKFSLLNFDENFNENSKTNKNKNCTANLCEILY